MKHSDVDAADKATIEAGNQGHEVKSAEEEAGSAVPENVIEIAEEVDTYEIEFKHCSIRKMEKLKPLTKTIQCSFPCSLSPNDPEYRGTWNFGLSPSIMINLMFRCVSCSSH